MAESHEAPPDPVWLRILESKLASTVVTVLVGGLVVQGIVTDQQTAAAEREAYFAAYERRLDQGSEHIEESFSDAGGMISAAENLAAVSEPEWDPGAFDAEYAARIRTDRERAVEDFNTVIRDWQRRREANALIMGHFLNTGDEDFADLWRRAQSAIDRFVTCTKGCYTRTLPPGPVFEPCDCDGLKLAAWAAINDFNRRVEDSRIYRPTPDGVEP